MNTANVFRALYASVVGSMALSCAASLQQPAAPPAPKEERMQILRCYADGYEARNSKKVELSQADLNAADLLYSKRKNSVTDSCDAIRKAYTDPKCPVGLTLQDLAENPDDCAVAARAVSRAGQRQPSLVNPAKLHEWNNKVNVDSQTRGMDH